MISVFENETDLDKKRFLMMSSTHTFVTVSDAKKAYTFFKRNCEQVLKALLVQDGSNITTATKENLNIDIMQLNDLANAEVRFAETHSWEDVNVRGLVQKTVLFVACGLRGFARRVRLEEGVDIVVYDSLKDMTSLLRNTTASIGDGNEHGSRVGRKAGSSQQSQRRSSVEHSSQGNLRHVRSDQGFKCGHEESRDHDVHAAEDGDIGVRHARGDYDSRFHPY
ncbi:hypothetical protein Aduo_018918 [Ancylostoma duodenale]